jgi:hypothetical protein
MFLKNEYSEMLPHFGYNEMVLCWNEQRALGLNFQWAGHRLNLLAGALYIILKHVS